MLAALMPDAALVLAVATVSLATLFSDVPHPAKTARVKASALCLTSLIGLLK
jgi:hypothetical protein